jgi:hypothetical protein
MILSVHYDEEAQYVHQSAAVSLMVLGSCLHIQHAIAHSKGLQTLLMSLEKGKELLGLDTTGIEIESLRDLGSSQKGGLRSC